MSVQLDIPNVCYQRLGSRFVVPVHTGVPRFSWYGSVTVDFDLLHGSVTVNFDRYRVCSSYRPVQGGLCTGTYRPYRAVQGGMENLGLADMPIFSDASYNL
ncbi:hypothetical protein B296_00057111 [Ensete ventricosum]|uniref:Uncharacterized protein n=1 Tax=Ensete ventricosum TaxID=4639 RepID=A0A426X240_ENSVE|nr:hypothetical protein B296_00057111 [Ensete ventricosum]